MHACDGQTDRRTEGQTEFSSLDRVCIACSAVKKVRTGQDRTTKKKSQGGNISPIWGEAPTVPIETKICVVGNLADVITCTKFQVKFLGVTILQGVEFPIFLLIFA